MTSFHDLPSQETIDRALAALKENGFNPIFVQNKEEAKKKVLELVPEDSQVFANTSITSEQIGLPEIFNNSGTYESVRVKMSNLDRNTQGKQLREIGSTPDYMVGSVHAVTQDGHVLIASRTGSQIPGYAHGAGKVIWVVGAQKIVKNIEEGTKRIFEYILPLEGERANKAYHITDGSKVDKLLTFYREEIPNRITLILINEILGF